LIYAGFGMGAETVAPDGLEVHIFSGAPTYPAPANFLLVDGLLQNFVYNDLGYSSATFNLDRDFPTVLAAQLGNGMQVTTEGLKAFADSGKKFIIWHGESDYSTSTNESIRFYRDLVAMLGGQVPADKFARLHVLPGVQHCGFNTTGPGANEFDKIAAIADWVEQGKPPETLLAQRSAVFNNPTFSRPLCAYPRYSRYNGSGDPTRAENFSCALP
jgi:hypothetical protein